MVIAEYVLVSCLQRFSQLGQIRILVGGSMGVNCTRSRLNSWCLVISCTEIGSNILLFCIIRKGRITIALTLRGLMKKK